MLRFSRSQSRSLHARLNEPALRSAPSGMRCRRVFASSRLRSRASGVRQISLSFGRSSRSSRCSASARSCGRRSSAIAIRRRYRGFGRSRAFAEEWFVSTAVAVRPLASGVRAVETTTELYVEPSTITVGISDDPLQRSRGRVTNARGARQRPGREPHAGQRRRALLARAGQTTRE